MKVTTLWSRTNAKFMVLSGMVVTTIMLAIVVVYFRSHLFWLYTERSLSLQNVRAIPDRVMPELPVPTSWIKQQVGCLTVSISKELTANRVVSEVNSNGAKFHDDKRTITFALYSDIQSMAGFVDSFNKVLASKEKLSLPKLRLESYRAGADNFRWSMNNQEVKRHTILMINSSAWRLHSGGHVETLFRQDLEGILHVDGSDATFDFQCINGKCGGTIQFKDRGSAINIEWIRQVCQSIKCEADS